ncbi:FG-GAP repeat protein [Streptomyces sp. 1222.5]|uniref:FG-GAP repeat protein n=2 Tax=Streptomyces sp. 1222.5 TaxID=1881026 RepID=UPI003D72FD05
MTSLWEQLCDPIRRVRREPWPPSRFERGRKEMSHRGRPPAKAESLSRKPVGTRDRWRPGQPAMRRLHQEASGSGPPRAAARRVARERARAGTAPGPRIWTTSPPVGTQASAGAVAVTQDSPNVPSGDEFGSSLTICDLDQDGRPDLAVGGGGEDGYHGAVRALPDRGSRPAIDRTLCAAGAWAVVVRCPHEAGR